MAGEVARGLIGAPAFSSTGGLAGLVLAEGGQDGLLLPVTTLRALTSVRLEDLAAELGDAPAGSRPGPAGPTPA